MNIKQLLLAAVAAVFAVSAAVAQVPNSDQDTKRKINEAVMGVYNDQLREHPDDYATLFARANQYYFNGDSRRALDDVNGVLKAVPE